ncbi:MAG: ABC transporter substrate-binding protein [Methanotrichaceae archaeon]
MTKGGRVEYERLGELIRDDLEEVGINVDLRSMDAKTVDAKVREGDFDLAVSGHGGLIGETVSVAPRMPLGSTIWPGVNT